MSSQRRPMARRDVIQDDSYCNWCNDMNQEIYCEARLAVSISINCVAIVRPQIALIGSAVPDIKPIHLR